MTKLRSREVSPPVPAKPLSKRSDVEPATPARTQESKVHRSPIEQVHGSVSGGSVPVDGPTTTSRRRSVRLASKIGDGDECVNGLTEKEVTISTSRKGTGKRRLKVDDVPVPVVEVKEGREFLSLRSGKRVAKRVVRNGVCDVENDCEKMEIDNRECEESEIDFGKLGFQFERKILDGNVRKMVEGEKEGEEVTSVNVSASDGSREVDSVEDSSFLNGKFILKSRVDTDAPMVIKSASMKRRKREFRDLVEENCSSDDKSENVAVNELCGDDVVVNGDVRLESLLDGTGDGVVSISKNEKGKAVVLYGNGDSVIGKQVTGHSVEVYSVENGTLDCRNGTEGRILVEDVSGGGDGKGKCEEGLDKPSSSQDRRRYTREEKGKGIMVENVSFLDRNDITDVDAEMEIKYSTNGDVMPEALGKELHVVVDVEQTKNTERNERRNETGNERRNESRTKQFHEIAKRNAARFAYFDAPGEEDDDFSDKEVEYQAEDWPGPFSTAMKIIKDREDNAELPIGTSLSNKAKSLPLIWVPRRDESFIPQKRVAPSLQELCMKILAKNADAITSLEYVPDALKHKLCQLLCDSRRMNAHFLDLIIRGSPAGICLPDCSWLTEEEFTECFKNCDTTNLTVLQLDQCGRCLPDYVLLPTLAKSPNNLRVLSSLSLNGAFRLTDVGLRALVSAAPAIRSINLSQCSLLTSSSIDILSDSLGSGLRELYINDCQTIDPKLILPALIKLQKLEVLSLAGFPLVRDRFVREFVTAKGLNLKQLILADCMKLTDSSTKAISENCPGLLVLDLANLHKLTDSSLGYLANGCQAMEKLILCRNAFSDDVVAAFLETAGSCLKELSLNNVKKVGHKTALSLGKHSRKLETLDLSWCRDMTDNALGYIVDSCLSMKVLKLFGCTQITKVFLDGYSNPNVNIIGLKMSPVLDHRKVPHHLEI
ncbi:PREDICTED: uncharacterized protein LOC104815331 [Tarenaya hassleriana]|uniref:uncharacterized protein LOC104815331 n=1 Tax=Tarenaya hassleriana TaxID=28532 RepID=UPI00053CA637|nr:PREDICTED: uncharacterized protein LOC104815331 [Tarenaya hassleriana]